MIKKSAQFVFLINNKSANVILTACILTVFFIISVVNPVQADGQSDGATDKSTIPILNKEQADKLSKESLQGEDIPLLRDADEDYLDQLQQKGSALIASTAQWLDSFFDDPRYFSEENRSRAKLKLGFGYTRFDDFEFMPGIDLILSFPGLENRASIYLQANDDDDFDADSNPISDTDKNKDEQLTAGIKYVMAMGERYNLSTDVGLSSNYIYGGVRYRHLHPFFSQRWEGRFTNRLRYYSDDGWQNKTSYDIERNLGERFFVRTTFTGVLSEEDEGFPFSGVVHLYQVLSIDKALLYDAGAYMNTEPDFEVTDVQLKLRYRQRFFRDWLVLEVAPQVTFPNDYDHEFNPGLVVKFEADFGYLQDHKGYDSIFKF